MSPDNIVMCAAFFVILMLGLLGMTVHDMLRGKSKGLIRDRVSQIAAMENVAQTVQAIEDNAELFRRDEDRRVVNQWITTRLKRIHSVSGKQGVRVLVGSTIASGPLALLVSWLTDVPKAYSPVVLIVIPLLVTRFVYKRLIDRFRNKFLGQFPDTIDLIVRAVRAGIPAVQAISVAGEEAEEPVRSEFRTMGDSLRLGVDLKDVLHEAVERIQIADFSFFSVCLLLQRETGGALTETLENLATIVRTRRDMRLKIRALTAEGRITSKIIAAVPFVTVGLLFLANRDYVMLLFDTTAGHHILIAAGVLMSIGMLLINKIANLETSR